ncbi:MAG TPA: hypothetical protein VMV27_14570 [Candidatus Binataceae bacterium]|nr:hypothetical protein [Candidatus Binataceae bacterium]
MTRINNMTLGAAMMVIAIAAVGSNAEAADVKTLGRLEIPAGAAVMAICTDPTVQNVLSGDLNAHPRAGAPILVTVTVTTRVLSEGVSLQDVSPGDPSVAGMLRDLGAQVPAIGNGGASVPDPFANEARRQNLTPDDPNTQSFRNYEAMNQSMSAGPETYNNLPASKIFDTAIIARATVSGSQSELKVVAVVHPGDDVHKAKELVGEEIANSILH